MFRFKSKNKETVRSEPLVLMQDRFSSHKVKTADYIQMFKSHFLANLMVDCPYMSEASKNYIKGALFDNQDIAIIKVSQFSIMAVPFTVLEYGYYGEAIKIKINRNQIASKLDNLELDENKFYILKFSEHWHVKGTLIQMSSYLADIDKTIYRNLLDQRNSYAYFVSDPYARDFANVLDFSRSDAPLSEMTIVQKDNNTSDEDMILAKNYSNPEVHDPSKNFHRIDLNSPYLASQLNELKQKVLEDMLQMIGGSGINYMSTKQGTYTSTDELERVDREATKSTQHLLDDISNEVTNRFNLQFTIKRR